MYHPREKITLQRQTQTGTDQFGNPVFEWVTYYEPKAVELWELEPSLDVIEQQENQTSYIRIKMRYNPEDPTILGDRIVWRGFSFHSIRTKVDRVKRKIEILCTSEMETTYREV